MANTPDARKPLRLWPGVFAVTLQWLLMYGMPLVFPQFGGSAIIAGLAAALIVLLWWLFFSRALWVERLTAIALMILAVIAIGPLLDPSIANGMMGFMPYVYSMPLLCVALVIWAATTRNLSTRGRTASLASAFLLACGTLTLVRTDGLTGDADSDFEWRWSATAEEKLLAHGGEEPAVPSLPTVAETPVVSETQKPLVEKFEMSPPEKLPPSKPDGARVERRLEWPGFRGSNRDGVVRDVRIRTDWSQNPPVELWRQPIGPGWSSFAVAGDRLYTQEQRGDVEAVSAYELKTGKVVWRHRDSARFWESNAGPGPRATPTLDGDRVYTLGATGILNALNARDGSVVWSRNAVTDTGKKIPDWGIASSPLVVDDLVIVATAGWLAAYDAATGKPRWFGPKEGAG